MIKQFLMLVMSFTLVGCVTSNAPQIVKPAFPRPSQHTLDKIKGLNDAEVNLWMEELFKLNKKLSQDKD